MPQPPSTTVLPPSIHLVVPCYRESSRLPQFLPGLCEALEMIGGSTLQVVDDGSGETEATATRDLVESLRTSHPLLLPLLSLPENIGKGGAVYAGWQENADAVWLGFVDADGSVPAEEVVRLVRMTAERSETASTKCCPKGERSEANDQCRMSKARPAIFASRVKMLGRKIDRQLKRHLLGRIYATLVSELLDIPVYDSQCGLKLVPSAAFRKIRPVLSVKGFAFDAELLLALRHSGCDVIEVPIDWHETPGGKIRLVRDAIKMTRDVLAIRHHSRGSAWRQSLGLDAG